MADILKAPPRNQTLGSLVDAYNKYVDPLLNKYEVLPQIPLIGGTTLGSLGANQIRNIANEMSYGNYQPVRNARNIQTMTIDPDTLDVASMIPFGGIAAKVGKPLAKAVGRGAAEKMAQHVDQLGLNQYIIPPEGNLNFTTRLDEQIKGPETQTVYDLLKQVQSKPGVTKEGLKKIAERYPDSAAKVTKEEFKANIPGSQYEKVDLTDAAQDPEDMIEHYLDQAMDYAHDADILDMMGVPEEYYDSVNGIVGGDFEFSDLPPETRQELSRIFGITENMDDNQIASMLDDDFRVRHHEVAYENARALAEQDPGYSTGEPRWQGYQRLLNPEEEGYFEIGVTHPDYQDPYRHYSGAPEGTIGHVRGTLLSRPTLIVGKVEVPPNSYIIEEIQSDAQQTKAQKGPLRQVHGVLFKSAIQDAIEKGADRVYLPTSEAIVRPLTGDRSEKSLELYHRVYDQEVKQEGLDPLSRIQGVSIKPILVDDVPYYYEIEMTPEAREHILQGPGQDLPGYAAGGLVVSDYDDESISQMADDLLGYGNRQTGEAKGKGALGEIRMPNGQDVMTEYSINVDGQEMPSIVEGMHPADINYIRETGTVPEDAVATAVRSARRREAEGKPVFYRKGGAVNNPFADMSMVDKIALLGRGLKKRHFDYSKEADKHGSYPDELSARLKTSYVEDLGNSRENRTPLDVAINYGGGYDFAANPQIPAQDVRDMAKAYQLWDYMTSFKDKAKEDAIGDYYENMAGVEAGIKGRPRGRMSEQDIARESAEYGKRKATAKPVFSEKGYAQGGLVYNDEQVNQLANQLFGV